MGISTDAANESDFMGEIEKLLADMMDTGVFQGDWEFQLQYWLPNIVDICCKYRGYKVEVFEKRWIYAGCSCPDEQSDGVASISNAKKVKINIPTTAELIAATPDEAKSA